MVDSRRKPDHVRMRSRSPLVISQTRPALWMYPASERRANGARHFVTDSGFTTGDGLTLGTDDHFIDFWVRTGTPTQIHPIFYGGSGSVNGLYAFLNASGYLVFRDGVGGAGNWTEVSQNSNPLTADVWSYYCVTVTRATRGIAMYRNGVATPIRTGSLPSGVDGASFTYAGATYISTATTGTRDFDLAGLGIGIGALPTTAEMAERYNSGVVLPYADLSAGLQAKYDLFWDLNEVSGNAIAQVGERNGTQVGTVGFAPGPGLADTPADTATCGYVASRDSSSITLTQPTPALMPTYSATGTGEAGLAFSGTQYLTASSVPITGETFDGIVTFKTGAAFSADQYLFSFSKLAVANIYGGIGIDATGHPFVETYDGTTQIRVTGNSVFDVESVYALQVSNTGTEISMRVVGKAADEVLTETTGTNDGTWAADMSGLDTFTVGGLRISSGNTLFTGVISDVRLYNTQQSVALMSQMRARIVATIVALSIPLWVLTNTDATLLAAGVTEYQLGTPAHFYAFDGSYDTTQISGDAVDAVIASYSTDKRPYIMDLEVFTVADVQTEIHDLLADPATRDWTVGQMNVVTDKWKVTPRRFGWYGTFPEQRDNYWTYINYLTYGEGTSYADVYHAWRAANTRNYSDLQLAEHAFVCPVLYAFYDQAWNRWEDFATGMCYEAHRVAKGKPVWPFMWAMYHPAGVGGPIALATWESMVEFVASLPVVDGIVAWTQDGDTPAEGWRDVLTTQMTGRIAVAPPVVIPPA